MGMKFSCGLAKDRRINNRIGNRKAGKCTDKPEYTNLEREKHESNTRHWFFVYSHWLFVCRDFVVISPFRLFIRRS